MIPPAGKRAIALEYDGNSAPHITAIGHDALAEQIIAMARENGVPMMENRELAALLSQLELGDEIPETLYRCVAQIIAFAYRLRGRVPTGWQEAEAEQAAKESESEAVFDADGDPSLPALPNPDASNSDPP
jgi:flagellar biosynthesis protein